MNNLNPLKQQIRRAVLIVALANLAYFFVEFQVAQNIGSVSLFADSIDFLEDTAVNLLIFVAFGWSLKMRSFVGMFLALILLIPAVFMLWMAWQKFNLPIAPDPWILSVTGLGALVVNLGCAFLLARFRNHNDSLTRAAFLSARNDALANIAIILAGFVTLYWYSGWPDLITGIGIAVLNADAAKSVWDTAQQEQVSAKKLTRP
ncbi:cobalt transporter [Nitrosomonas sp. PY1]|uniref:cation transporter n=1 Tax=Nitrosomonas sp. PY1 TaxID=1803906 RepID=UPI001FC876DA|nr:cation diffusion facilitator family transporter [Nitrosomonas sp. PY1]GKS70409.1 cobalt transporter [Nitrosomonas sp. PY1]